MVHFLMFSQDVSLSYHFSLFAMFFYIYHIFHSQDLCFSFFLHKHWFLISGFPKKQYKVSVRAAISVSSLCLDL
uniref:Uncharacterized protein n=1 Tax=Cannabis sativa TaxID=3483 RepID=A0A803QVI8_CANSA